MEYRKRTVNIGVRILSSGNYDLFKAGICQMLGALFEMQEARMGTMWGNVILTIPIDASAVKWETLKLLGTIHHWGNMSVGLNALELEKSIVRLYAHLRAHQQFLPGECMNYLGALATPQLGSDLVSRSLHSAERSSGLGPSADQVAAWSQTSPPVTVAGAAWWSDLNETLSRMSLN